MSDSTARRIPLPDGRALGYADLGDPVGRPVLYFHGFPGSRLEARMIEGAAREHGVRLIAVDRPGYGLSDFLPGRDLSDWPADILGLADGLGLERFAVVGASGGGPYAAVCARRIPERLTLAGLACALGPPESLHEASGMLFFNRLGLRLSRHAPWLTRPLLFPIGTVLRRYPDLAMFNLSRSVSSRDREALDRPEIREGLTLSIREAFRTGTRGAARDGMIYGRPWGFRLEEVETMVYLWHGTRDRVVPVAMTRYMEGRLPHSQATYFADEGHFSIIVNRAKEMFSVLRRAP